MSMNKRPRGIKTFEFDSHELTDSAANFMQRIEVSYSHCDAKYSDIELIQNPETQQEFELSALPQADQNFIDEKLAALRSDWIADGNGDHESPIERGMRIGED